MKKIKVTVAALLLAIGVIAGGAVPAQAWLSAGEHTQHTNEGGEWVYGFWNAWARSYYTIGQCHGSTVVVDGNHRRSEDTSPWEKSIAEKFALNFPWSSNAYYYRTC